MMADKKLLIMGFGGHARSVADVALACGYIDLLFVDIHAIPNENFLGHPVLKNLENLDNSWRYAIAASGDSRLRREQCASIELLGLTTISLISPTATVGLGSVIGPGSFVGHHAHIGPMVEIGRACIINTGAAVEHESYVGDYSHVSVNAIMAGRSKLGSFSMVGAGAVIIDGVSVSDEVIIGAAAAVIDDIQTSGTYVGVPALRIS